MPEFKTQLDNSTRSRRFSSTTANSADGRCDCNSSISTDAVDSKSHDIMLKEFTKRTKTLKALASRTTALPSHTWRNRFFVSKYVGQLQRHIDHSRCLSNRKWKGYRNKSRMTLPHSKRTMKRPKRNISASTVVYTLVKAISPQRALKSHTMPPRGAPLYHIEFNA